MHSFRCTGTFLQMQLCAKRPLQNTEHTQRHTNIYLYYYTFFHSVKARNYYSFSLIFIKFHLLLLREIYVSQNIDRQQFRNSIPTISILAEKILKGKKRFELGPRIRAISPLCGVERHNPSKTHPMNSALQCFSDIYKIHTKKHQKVYPSNFRREACMRIFE